MESVWYALREPARPKLEGKRKFVQARRSQKF